MYDNIKYMDKNIKGRVLYNVYVKILPSSGLIVKPKPKTLSPKTPKPKIPKPRGLRLTLKS